MNINETNTFSHQVVPLDKKQKFVKFNHRGHWKGLKQWDDLVPVFQITAGEFTNDKWMAHNLGIH